jgi:NitT/TauT family transport system substrate-binding protein
MGMSNRLTMPRMRRVGVALSLAFAMVLTACGGTATNSSDGPKAEGEPLDQVGSLSMGTVAIPPIFAMVLPYVARDAGFFDKYGVDVQLRDMKTGVDAARAVQGGDLDFAFSPTGPVMSFAGKGAQVTSLMGMDNVDWLVGTVNPENQRCADLAGDTIAVDSVGGARYSVLELILDSCGLSINDVETVSLPGAPAIQAIVAGQIDTAVLHLDDLHVIEEQSDKKMLVVEWLKDVRPDQHYLIAWALSQTVQEKRPQLVRALAAMTETVRFMQDKANHDRVVEIAQVTGHNSEVSRAALKDFLEIEFWPVDRHGLPKDKIEPTINEQVRLGNIPKNNAPQYSQVVDTSVWEEAFELVRKHGRA